MDEIKVILHGIRIDGELQIADGITLTPLPNSSEDSILISPELPTIITKEPTSYLGRVLLSKTRSNEFPIPMFLQHLSLICNNAVHPVKEWIQPQTSGPSGISVHSYRDDPSWPTVDISESHISETKEQFDKFMNLPPKVKDKLDIAIPRWVKSKTETNIINRIIDLVIAFEVLYLDDSSAQHQLSLAFRLRAAWHLGSDVQERQNLLSLFKEIYATRSNAVHRGNFTADNTILAKADRLCAQAIKKFIDDGKFPNWDSLVVGGTGEQS